MKNKNKPHFVIKKNLQKSGQTNRYFRDDVTPDVLEKVCYRITGISDFTYEYVDNSYEDEFLKATYNKGRLVMMHYQDTVSYISFSEKNIGGRNSSVQSVSTAFNMFYMNDCPNKKLYYYFLNVGGKAKTEYQIFYYRLMRTIGFNFLNVEELEIEIDAFSTVEDIIRNRLINAGKNKSNNSTFVTKNEHGTVEVYGKTYGASKYESSMVCYALSNLIHSKGSVDLYEICEGDLEELPKTSLEVISKMGNINVIPTSRKFEKKQFEKKNSLRSPNYIYNLSKKLGDKHCAMCDCAIPELVQGAHILPVADIKKKHNLSDDQKLEHAISGENGIWLCENHHKLFDTNMITFNKNGYVIISEEVEDSNVEYIKKITLYEQLDKKILTEKFLEYLELRNEYW